MNKKDFQKKLITALNSGLKTTAKNDFAFWWAMYQVYKEKTGRGCFLVPGALSITGEDYYIF